MIKINLWYNTLGIEVDKNYIRLVCNNSKVANKIANDIDANHTNNIVKDNIVSIDMKDVASFAISSKFILKIEVNQNN